ncbi:MAG: hypothetical protein LLG05_14065 [Porphyromonadaceae bacterium]|nr:hypothetical protein [Porphyromonadaceae bacterium]
MKVIKDMATITENGKEVIKKIVTADVSQSNQSYPIWFFNKIVGSVTYEKVIETGLLSAEFVFSDENIIEGFKAGRYWLDYYVIDKPEVRFLKSLAELDELYFTDFEKKCMGKIEND